MNAAGFSRRALLCLSAALLPGRAGAAAGLRIVAAENVYGDLASQIGGGFVSVRSILNNPNQDPHLFAASPAVAIALADADVVIVNGADYDPWMAGLLAAEPSRGRVVITVADLLGRKPGDNPHFWYDPKTAPLLGRYLAQVLAKRDPAHAAAYAQNASALLASLKPITARITAMRAEFAGTPVSATEPVYGLMAAALGLTMRNSAFQTAVMNGTEPGPAEVAAFEDDLRRRNVRILFYNSQVTDDLTRGLLALARQSGVPVIGVTETEPAGTRYQSWMNAGLNAVEKALRAE